MERGQIAFISVFDYFTGFNTFVQNGTNKSETRIISHDRVYTYIKGENLFVEKLKEVVCPFITMEVYSKQETISEAPDHFMGMFFVLVDAPVLFCITNETMGWGYE